MITFKVAQTKTGKTMVEVWRDDIFIAGILEYKEGNIQLISEYYDDVQREPGLPPSVIIKFSEEQGERRGLKGGEL